MSNYRGLIWSLVAIAGTATAATVAYRYVTRNTHAHDDDDNDNVEDNADASRATGDSQQVADNHSRDDAYESLSESEYDSAFALDGDDIDTLTDAQQSQQMVLVAREGNLLLSVFGVVLMLVVGAVSLIVAWTSDDIPSPADLPMFAPLMWIAIGIFTAASVEVLSQSALTTSEVPVLEPKAVFPHDESDFELIRQHDGESLASPANATATQSTTNKTPGADVSAAAAAAASVSSPPSSPSPTPQVSSALTALLTTADSLNASEQHREAREFLLAKLADYSDEVEVLWRLARATYSVAEETRDAEEKKALVLEGLTHAEKAYAADANSAASNLWMAILTSSVGNYRDLKDKIAGAYVIRDHTQRSIELNPLDPTPHHILGNWALAFADMTWIEKRAAAALFGTPPTATYDDVVTHLLAAERLNPGGWKKNAYLLAETYLKMKRPSDAAKWAIVARDAPQQTKDDRETHALVLALVKKLKL